MFGVDTAAFRFRMSHKLEHLPLYPSILTTSQASSALPECRRFRRSLGGVGWPVLHDKPLFRARLLMSSGQNSSRACSTPQAVQVKAFCRFRSLGGVG